MPRVILQFGGVGKDRRKSNCVKDNGENQTELLSQDMIRGKFFTGRYLLILINDFELNICKVIVSKMMDFWCLLVRIKFDQLDMLRVL